MLNVNVLSAVTQNVIMLSVVLLLEGHISKKAI